MSVELIQNGMRYAGMVRIADQVTADRYNDCLQKFGLKPVATVPFHVDACGFSLEVANKLENKTYLNPDGVGRRFIIVTALQEQAPYVDVTFSFSKPVMKAFYQANRASIARMTLKDAIYGQLSTNTAVGPSLADIVAMRSVSFEVQTINGTGRKTAELEMMIETFKSDRSLWADLNAMERIVELAKDVGDVRTAPAAFDTTAATVPDHFNSSLFGGFALIDGMLIGDETALGQNPPLPVLNTASGGQILGNFVGKDYIEPFNPDWLMSSGVLERRIHSLACDLLPDAMLGAAQRLVDANLAEALIQNNITALNRDSRFEALIRLRKAIIFTSKDDADQAERGITAKVRLSLRRANRNYAAAFEINRILAAYAPYDPVTLYATDKPAFYREFDLRSENRQRYWIEAVKAFYLNDKTANRKRLFG
jgi:hypothetical protein